MRCSQGGGKDPKHIETESAAASTEFGSVPIGKSEKKSARQEGAGDTYIFDVLGIKHDILLGEPSASVFVTAATAAYDPSKPETKARGREIMALGERFAAVDDPVLHLIAEGKLPAGPELGNPNFDEEQLKSLAKRVLDRRDDHAALQEKWRNTLQSQQWSLFEKIVAGIVVGVVGGIGFLLGKFLF